MLDKLDIAVINLDRRPDRMAYIYKNIPFLFRPSTPKIPGVRIQYAGTGDTNRGYYRRFPAIDGMNLSHYYSEFSELLETIRNKPRVLGEVGCSLSHYSLWKSHAEEPISEYLLVFEDDVMFTKDSIERIRATVSELADGTDGTDGTDVVYVGGQWTPNYNIERDGDGANTPYFTYQRVTKESLGTYFRTAPEPGSAATVLRRRNLAPAVIQGSRNVWFTPLFRTAGAYLVSQRGAKRLLEAVQSDTALFMKTPLDMWLLEMDFRGYIQTADRFPHPFYQAGFEMVREPSHAKNDIHRTDFKRVALNHLH
jgi:GR25 family glycosyltransferase involved in LPS biosynthesis